MITLNDSRVRQIISESNNNEELLMKLKHLFLEEQYTDSEYHAWELYLHIQKGRK